MKNIKKIAYAFAAVLLTSTAIVSCTQDFDEINKSPNNPETALSYGVWNAANKIVTDATRNSFESARVTLPWMQYSAQVAYTEEDRYQYRLTSGDAIWTQLFTAASNYKKIIDMNTDPATAGPTSAYGSNANQIAASRVMLSYVFLNLADTFGDIPYYSYGNNDADFQALNANEYLRPKFASQAKVYADIMKELKEAAAMVEVDQPVFIQGDILFGGDGTKLKKFANSLRLRVATRVKGVVPGAEAHLAEAIAAGVMTSNADNVGVTYENNLVNPSPMYNDFRTRSDFSVSKTFIDLLKGTNGNFGLDPRLFKYAAPMGTLKATILDGSYTESTDPADYVGQPYGLDQSMSTAQAVQSNFFSKYVYKRNYTEILMEYSEVEFLLSEANGWSQSNYEKGVKASMTKWGVSAAAADAFVATLPPANMKNVLTQKYVALFMQPYEAWADYRRTGYPDTSVLLLPGETYALNVPDPVSGATTYVFEPLIAGLTDLPTRLFYPTVIQTLNPENYAAASAAIGGDTMKTKLIWDKN
ncbi:MAG: SusD/RagB family nutrient-binding outer membrane lipoprotein [Flavobacteriia bacterium]|nr:SusD/RagB family nutrient-binding outer membrane lipoprotein [Flavobacteriia bacterium]MBH2024263.1 SusD/RagB family nutrient-binding outer membrane lipoprotein [Flavobacteriales bacterium]